MKQLKQLSEEEKAEALNRVKNDVLQRHKRINERYMKGVIIKGVHHPLFVFLQGRIEIREQPKTFPFKNVSFPGLFYTMHIGLDIDQNPFFIECEKTGKVLVGIKYYFKTYEKAKRIALKISNTSGIEIIEKLDSTESHDLEDGIELNYTTRSMERYRGGSTGDLYDDFIDDVLDGDSDAYWNID